MKNFYSIISIALFSIVIAGCNTPPVKPPISSQSSTEKVDVVMENKDKHEADSPIAACCAPTEEERGTQQQGELQLVIHFAFAKYDISPAEQIALKNWALSNAKLHQFEKPTIIIGGHADSRGSNDINKALSGRRAQVVADYLKSIGAATNGVHWEVAGFGDTVPVDAAEDEAAWAKNRRTEIRILKLTVPGAVK